MIPFCRHKKTEEHGASQPSEPEPEVETGASASDTEHAAKHHYFFKDLIDGSFLTKDIVQRQLPYVFFLVLLAMFYINNRFAYERQLLDLQTLKHELETVKYKSLETEKQLIQMSTQSALLRHLQQSGSEVHEAQQPPIIVE